MDVAVAWLGALLLGALGAGVVLLVAEAARRRRAARGRTGDRTLWYWLRRGGLPQGPVPAEHLLAMRLDGRLDADVMVARAGSDRWQPIATLHGAARPARRPQP